MLETKTNKTSNEEMFSKFGISVLKFTESVKSLFKSHLSAGLPWSLSLKWQTLSQYPISLAGTIVTIFLTFQELM